MADVKVMTRIRGVGTIYHMDDGSVKFVSDTNDSAELEIGGLYLLYADGMVLDGYRKEPLFRGMKVKVYEDTVSNGTDLRMLKKRLESLSVLKSIFEETLKIRRIE